MSKLNCNEDDQRNASSCNRHACLRPKLPYKVFQSIICPVIIFTQFETMYQTGNLHVAQEGVLRITLHLKFVCFTNQRFILCKRCDDISGWKSKFRKSSGITLEISRSEMFFPIQFRDPRPNYTTRNEQMSNHYSSARNEYDTREVTDWEIIVFHRTKLFWVRFKPTLRPKLCGIGTEDGFVVVCYPRINTDSGLR